MGQTWFRGEAVGVVPIPADKTADHDIGDGMYLTDNKASAVQYADLRATDPAARRVFSVVIDQSSLRVLDLTADPRWQKDLRVVEPSIKAANVNYGRVFANFVKANAINLDQYDAVIGMDYVRGGRQMCILYKNARPTNLQSVIRSNFRPEPIGAEPPLDSGSITRRMPGGSGGFGEGMMIVGFGLIDLALQLLAPIVQEWADKQWLDRQMTDLEPTIKEEIGKHAAATANLQSQGRKAFANITIEIQNSETRSEIGTIHNVPIMKLVGVSVSANEVNLDQGVTKTTDYGTIKWIFQQYTYSTQVAVSPTELALFKSLMLEYQFFDQQAHLNPGNPGMGAGLAVIRQAIISAFGPAAAADVLDAWMWPKFVYRGQPLKK
jgi:hypothetical protein